MTAHGRFAHPIAAIACGMLAACAGRTTPAPTTSTAVQEGWTTLTPKIRLDRANARVEFDAVSVIEVGFLEAYVCTVGTREHESLFAFDGTASEVHAALLLAGLVPGTPGRWREIVPEGGGDPSLELMPPKGPPVSVTVVLPDGATHPIEWFARHAPTGAETVETHSPTPPHEFVFAGSRFVTDRKTGAERYVADGSGSLIGLVTFGDETVGAIEVIPDQLSAAAAVWEVDPTRIPRPGTPVRIRVAKIASHGESGRSDGDQPTKGAPLGNAGSPGTADMETPTGK